MDIQDVLFNRDVNLNMRQAVLAFIEAEGITDPYLRVLTPTATNDDVNGSQHVTTGGKDFTYEDVDVDEVNAANTLGFYEYFSEAGRGVTGHYYDGNGVHFAALVIDPPTYAVEVTV